MSELKLPVHEYDGLVWDADDRLVSVDTVVALLNTRAPAPASDGPKDHSNDCRMVQKPEGWWCEQHKSFACDTPTADEGLVPRDAVDAFIAAFVRLNSRLPAGDEDMVALAKLYWWVLKRRYEGVDLDWTGALRHPAPSAANEEAARWHDASAKFLRGEIARSLAAPRHTPSYVAELTRDAGYHDLAARALRQPPMAVDEVLNGLADIAAWHRRDDRTYLSIRVADGADLSCVATRRAALQAALGEKP